MAKSKRAPTLLEVIDRKNNPDKRGFGPPAWWKSAPPRSRQDQVSVPPDSGSSTPSGNRRALQVGALRIPLTPNSAVVALGSLVILVLVVSQLSGARHQPPTQSGLLAADGAPSVEQVRNQTPRSDALDVILGRHEDRESAAKARHASAELPAESTLAGPDLPASLTQSRTRRPGLNYVVVESFPGESGPADALEAGNFLARKGIRTTTEVIGTSTCLVTERGFNAGDPELQDFRRRIEKLGEEYFAAGGEYRFKGCYGKLYRSNGW